MPAQGLRGSICCIENRLGTIPTEYLSSEGALNELVWNCSQGGFRGVHTLRIVSTGNGIDLF